MWLCLVDTRCGVFVFFFKQKTAYEMRISDWSSDVCSSDLPGANLTDRAGVFSSTADSPRALQLEDPISPGVAPAASWGRSFRPASHRLRTANVPDRKSVV